MGLVFFKDGTTVTDNEHNDSQYKARVRSDEPISRVQHVRVLKSANKAYLHSLGLRVLE